MKRRRLGQHYLVDREVVHKIVEAAGIAPDERVLEIGTGRGELTEELVRLGGAFEGFEIDRANYDKTVARVRRLGGKIRWGDAFRAKPEFDVLVASLPYSKSMAVIEWLSTVEYRRAVLLLQEDFVRKIMAAPGTRDYRAASALTQIASDVEVLGRVRRDAFSPPPRVNSLLVSVRPKARLSRSEVLRVKRLFSLRKRRVSSALSTLDMGKASDDFGTRRVYSLTPDEVHRLCSSARHE